MTYGKKCTFCAGISERRSALQAHLRGVGVAGDRTAALYADAAEFIGERKPFVQPCSGQTGQRGAVSTGGVQLPQKRPYKAIPCPGGIHGPDGLAGRAAVRRTGVGVGPGAAACVEHELHVSDKERGQCGVNVRCAGQKFQLLVGDFDYVGQRKKFQHGAAQRPRGRARAGTAGSGQS